MVTNHRRPVRQREPHETNPDHMDLSGEDIGASSKGIEPPDDLLLMLLRLYVRSTGEKPVPLGRGSA
jgi:hypothetical protein